MMETKKILIFQAGQLGDTLVSVPCLRVIRDNFAQAHITLLSDNHTQNGYVLARDVLDGSTLVDDYQHHYVKNSRHGKITRGFRLASLLFKLRSLKFDMLIYLVPSRRSRYQVYRDLLFFRLAGIKKHAGTEGFPQLPAKVPTQPLETIGHEADLLLSRLARAGIAIPKQGEACIDLKIGKKEIDGVQSWLENLPSDGGKQWIALGPGSKMPSKIWPVSRYIEVLQRLIAEFDIWPVIFGSSEEKELCNSIIKKLGKGYVAAGHLTVRQAVAAMKKCYFYLGNDTGAIHIAAAAGIKCVGIYSSRDYPEHWEPYGHKHVTFRSQVSCEGCFLNVCNENKKKCIMAITADQVYQACAKFMNQLCQKNLSL